MQTISQLLEAMHSAARGNRKDEFDRLEAELLSRFEGGFEGMPDAVYERYLEVDRAWPVIPQEVEPSAGVAPGEASQPPVGPPVALQVELPEELVSWIAELGDQSGCGRSEVLTECLQTLRSDRRIAAALAARLAARYPR